MITEPMVYLHFAKPVIGLLLIAAPFLWSYCVNFGWLSVPDESVDLGMGWWRSGRRG